MTGLDIYDPDIYEAGVPHERFRQLREQSPVFFHPEPQGPGFWAVMRHADVAAVSKDAATFSSARRGTQIADPSNDQLPLVRTMMLNLDPPQHGKFRQLVQTGFTPRMVALLEPRIRELARGIVDRALAKGECDFVREVAAPLPLQVIGELMGVPTGDRPQLAAWGDRLVGFDDPEFDHTAEDALGASVEMYTYALELAETRKQPDNRADALRGEDLATVLVNSKVDGQRITDEEFGGLFVQMTVAGNETTRTLISGGMLALSEHPDQFARLHGEPEMMSTAVEEMLRFVSPLHQFRRTATREVELCGQSIHEDDKVVLFYSSANRDAEVFADPDLFDVGRRPNPHLAFGLGEHFCLGAALARLEIKVLFEELVARVTGCEVIGAVRRLRSNQTNGIKEMPVRLSAA